MFSPDFLASAAMLLDACRAKGLKIATAESCTGGLLAGVLTEIPGSSDVFERGFVTYSNDAKAQMLGVSEKLLADHGAVSGEVAVAMAEGVLAHALADLSCAITGIAGPGGGSAEKPVGLVYIAVACDGRAATAERFLFPATARQDIRMASVRNALRMMSEVCG